VLTTRGPSTNASISWEDFCYFPGENSAASFAEKALELAPSREKMEKGELAGKYYEREFSWPAIARGLLARISK
jgi:hypothetical protein